MTDEDESTDPGIIAGIGAAGDIERVIVLRVNETGSRCGPFFRAPGCRMKPARLPCVSRHTFSRPTYVFWGL